MSAVFRYTEKKLAKDIGRVAEAIDPSLQYSYRSDTQEVKLTWKSEDGGGPYTIYLGNLFRNVSALPRKERRPAIEAFLRDILTPKKLSADELMASLALRVRTEFEIDLRNRHLELMGHGTPQSITQRLGELLIEVVSDRDQSVSLASSDDLAEIDVSEEDALRMAAARIRRDTDGGQWDKVSESIWMSKYQDDYDFARLVAADDFGRFPFDEPHVVFAPSHSVCLVTNSAEPAVLSQMIELGDDMASSHRPFSQLLWTTATDGDWKVWQPDRSSSGFEVAELQSARETIGQYEEMKGYFERLLGEDVFVASYQAIKSDDGIKCYCVYTFDLPSYLPLTDTVALVDPHLPQTESVVGEVDWQAFVDCLGPANIEAVEDTKETWFRVMQPLDASRKERLREMARPFN